jgi:Rrf2 family protein
MTFSKTTEYALRTLAFMSLSPRRPLSSAHLHGQLRIPKRYLQRLLTALAKHGLIRSTRGRNGGYVIARSLRKIALVDIVEAVEGFDRSSRCFFGFPACPVENPCAMHDVWTAHQRSLTRTLTSTTLADILPRDKS